MSTTLAILGGGQLGRMLALAAAPLGVRVRALDPNPDACAGDVCELIVGAFDDPLSLERLTRDAQAVTYEFENIPQTALDRVRDAGFTLRPGPRSIAVASDRLLEKQHLASIGIAVAPFAPVHDHASLTQAVETIGTPAILKTRTGGYDGKGQAPVDEPSAAEDAWSAIDRRPAVLEQRLSFERELAAVVCRSQRGDTTSYPLTQTRHERGILVRAHAPAQTDQQTSTTADSWAATLADSLEHVGTLALELFDTPAGLIANEFAPRVHNSGHWTIDGCRCSQFENHVRAVLGWPLGATQQGRPSVMLNLIGAAPDPDAIAAIPGAAAHLYRKAPKPGRKIGHVTFTADTLHKAVAAADKAEPALRPCE
ncbi:MAG: 5-(carboxyamino)imidazole ribonucleotide synthase [Planctomycetota bacterium]